jgi:hypothetical protein
MLNMDHNIRRTLRAGMIPARSEKRYKGGKSGSAPAPDPSLTTPAKVPDPTYRADDGTMFTNVDAYNGYQANTKNRNFASGLDSAYQRSYLDSQQAFRDYGIDPTGYDAQIKAELDKLRGTVPNLAENPSTYFRNVGSDIIKNNETTNRNSYNNTFNSQYGNNWANTAIGDTSDDAILENILNEQKDPVNQYLQRAKDRGTLNGSGYDHAMQEFERQMTAARAKLNTIGTDVITGNRTKLNDERQRAADAISGYKFGQDFKLDDYTSGLSSKANNFLGTLEGDIRNQLSGVKLFDQNALLLSGGQAQGPINDQGALFDQFINGQKKKDNRGLNSNGGTF